jgi:mono/diheme cytochrome c family protein
MGWDGQWSPPPSNASRPDRVTRAAGSRGAFLLAGEDVYRLSCRACHKPDGSGAPPEINSLIGPVQSASASWMTQRMKAAGRPVDPAFIRKLTLSTELDLRKRLKVGGHSMPSFDHLSDDEIAVLRPYLDELASVPGAARRRRLITEPPDRAGELIVKGTCHICHDAVGANEPTTVLSGVIPSLAAVSRQHTVFQFVKKAHEGSPVPLSTGNVMSRGRMPVFAYLSEAEIAAAYSYLAAYPPR